MSLFDYFDDFHFAYANGISATGGAVGMAILPLLTELFIETYGWRSSLVILAALDMNCVVGGALMKPLSQNTSVQDESIDTHSPDGLSNEEDDEANKFLREATPSTMSTMSYLKKAFSSCLKTLLSHIGFELFREKPRFTLYQLLFMMYAIPYSAWTVFIVSHMLENGVTPHKAAYISFVAGVGNCIGRISTGPLLDNNIISSTGLFSVMSFVSAVTLLVDPLAHTYPAWAVFAAIVALAIGARFPLNVTIAREFASGDGLEDLAVAALGWTYVSIGLGCLIGPPIVG